MSFGFVKSTHKLHCIRDAILYAHSKNTVLFAAARNNGALEEVAYPASQGEVICINSSDGKGTPSTFNPSNKKDNICSAVGEAVLSSWLHNEQRRMYGTSFATPIAAGIAAATMDYMEQESKGWPIEDRYMAERIKTKAGIVAVFDKHLSYVKGGGDVRFLSPWRFFNKGQPGLMGHYYKPLGMLVDAIFRFKYENLLFLES